MPSRDVPPHRPTRTLPVAVAHTGGRATVTCRYRCGSACAHPAPNPTDNAYLGDIVTEALSRRSVLRAVAVLGLAGAASSTFACTTPAAPAAPGAPAAPPPGQGFVPGLSFAPVAPNTADAVIVAEGYTQQVVVRWASRS